MAVDLDELFELRELSREQIMQRLRASPEHVDPGVTYQSLEGVDRLHAPAHPAHFYFRGDELLMIYVPEGALDGVTPEQLEARLDGEGERLRSRAGRDAALWVHAEQGVAYVAEDGAVISLEVFPPTGFERYRDEIWWEPPEFIR